ncbi:Protein alcS [Lachnellula occidentalis]|uniref:Protein alcS n=1 Tax=Lachnellula occidentalis TaxID=215460 RepID=A0A8H8UIE0_9HELO|nr:Protein alcS [Lachnellula occidentalis]
MAAAVQNGNHAPANGNGDYLEKDFSNPNHLNDPNMSGDDALKRMRTAGSISISPELFEKLYLSPQSNVKGDLRKTFANPTPVGLMGFLLALTPLSCDLMGWRGAGGNGAASIGAYFFFGGLLMLVAGLLEFVLGNTYSFVVFMAYGAFWLTYGSVLQPFFAAYASYSTTTTPADGLQTVGFTASLGFFLLFMGLLSFIFLICSLRVNVAFVVIFLSLTLGFVLLAGAYWEIANGIGGKDPSAIALAGRLQIAGGASLFVTCMSGWWIFFAIMLAALDFPFQIPVGDLSTLIKGASTRQKEKDMV